MQAKRTFKVSTKLNKSAAAKTTMLTMDYTGVTAAELQGPAEDSLVIVWQGRKRRTKNIPATETIMVKDFIASMGRRDVTLTAENIGQAAETMSPEQRANLRKKLEELEKAEAAAKAPQK